MWQIRDVSTAKVFVVSVKRLANVDNDDKN